MLEHPDRAEAELREEPAIRHHPLVELMVTGTGSPRGCYDAAEFDSLISCHSRPPWSLVRVLCHSPWPSRSGPAVGATAVAGAFRSDHDQGRQARYHVACHSAQAARQPGRQLPGQNTKVE